MLRMPKVALLVETSRGYGRSLLRGVVSYSRLHGPWGFYLTPGDFVQALPRMRSWGGTGIIARVQTPEVARAILASGLPTIALGLSDEQLRPENPLSRLSEVVSDSRVPAASPPSICSSGVSATTPTSAHRVASGRGDAKRAFAHGSGRPAWSPECTACPGRCAAAWEHEQPVLADWLVALPKPVGVMACNDDRGREVLEACRVAGLRVPEEVAVVGVDNDELLCELADPPLSSVVLNAEAGGYRAAALLDQMMRGRNRKPQRLLVEPMHVVARRSTDIVALDDPEVAAAVHFIQDHATEPIGVSDIVEEVMISRRALELRFQRAIGRTPHAEIRRVRLERATRLLVETDLPITRVAEVSGFGQASYLSQVFSQAFGSTPARYRRRMRGGSSEEH